MKRHLRKPSPALVLSLIALFVALGGTSYAATSLARNSVGTKQLKNNAVTSAKIANGAVTAAKINTTGLSVPNADHATNADSATSATNATKVGGLSASQLQKAVTGTCGAGSAIRVVDSSGAVTCQTIPTVLSATVKADSTLVDGIGAISAESLGTDDFEVDFNRDVSSCAFAGTIGQPATGTASGDIDVQPYFNNPDSVYVETWSNNGSLASALPFHLIVVC